MRKNKKNIRGFTLPEIIMTITIGTIIIPPIIIMLLVALRAPVVISGAIKGNSLASDLMEEILSKRWDEASTGTGPIADGIKTLPVDLGLEAGETRINFNDIDDFNNYSETPPQNAQGIIITDFSDYTRKVEIFYVEGGNSEDYDTELSNVSNFKKILITVTGPNSTNRLEAITSNR